MGRRSRNKWQMLDPSQEPSFGPWIKCQKLEDKITMPPTSWRKYILWPHVNSSSHNSFPYNGIILCRKEIMDDEGKPLSGSTMWQKPGNLPKSMLSTELNWFPAAYHLNLRHLDSFFIQINVLNQKEALVQSHVYLQLGRLLWLGQANWIKFQRWAGWHKKSHFYRLSSHLFSVKWENPDLPSQPAVML